MSARPCSTCGASRNSGVHLRTSSGYHPYTDARGAARLAPQSSGRTEYLRSEAHQRVYGEARAADGAGVGLCLAHIGGAPGECSRDRVPHHIAGRGAFGGQKASERQYPVVMVCAYFNEAVEAVPEVRRWAERTTFERDGAEYPFRMRQTERREVLTTFVDEGEQ